ncbi:hypothetical protein [Bradyrhizobium sp. Rc2d]|uniref:hypothetical protein n=1 Tax=Bradyrhizobium sp. Rc2d TaxID=1855321 RepID=UPI000B83812E|nr:hypothetical protein [Bradyrhizobium sp. Rc2d]
MKSPHDDLLVDLETHQVLTNLALSSHDAAAACLGNVWQLCPGALDLDFPRSQFINFDDAEISTMLSMLV